MKLDFRKMFSFVDTSTFSPVVRSISSAYVNSYLASCGGKCDRVSFRYKVKRIGLRLSPCSAPTLVERDLLVLSFTFIFAR